MHCLLRQVYSLRKLESSRNKAHSQSFHDGFNYGWANESAIVAGMQSQNVMATNAFARIWMANSLPEMLVARKISKPTHMHKLYLRKISSYDAECELIVMNFHLSFYKLPFTQLLTSFMAGFRGEIKSKKAAKTGTSSACTGEQQRQPLNTWLTGRSSW